MRELRKLIEDNLEKFPDYDDYYVQIDLIQDDKQDNGVKLDAAKSLLEGIAKTMLVKLDPAISDRQIEGLKIKGACERALKELARRTADFDEDFVARMLSVIVELGTARSKKGALSHGHKAPRQVCSPQYIKMVTEYVATTARYMLEHFYTIDFSYQEPEKYNAPENANFNDYIDEGRESIGKVPYSEALYRLDYDAYIAERDAYNAGYDIMADTV